LSRIREARERIADGRSLNPNQESDFLKVDGREITDEDLDYDV
jgi:hypothetical protein